MMGEFGQGFCLANLRSRAEEWQALHRGTRCVLEIIIKQHMVCEPMWSPAPALSEKGPLLYPGASFVRKCQDLNYHPKESGAIRYCFIRVHFWPGVHISCFEVYNSWCMTRDHPNVIYPHSFHIGRFYIKRPYFTQSWMMTVAR